MGDARWERYGAWGGVAFVVLDVGVGVIAGEPPGTGARRNEVVSYFADNAQAVQAGLWVFGLATMALLWWSGSLWRWMVRAEAGRPRLAVVSMVGLAMAGALSLASSAVAATLALRIDDVGDDVVIFNALALLMLAAAGLAVAAHVLATCAAGARAGTMPAWLVGVGVVSAVGFVSSAVLATTGHDDPASALGLLGFVGWCVWILGVSWGMWRVLRVGSPALAAAATTVR